MLRLRMVFLMVSLATNCWFTNPLNGYAAALLAAGSNYTDAKAETAATPLLLPDPLRRDLEFLFRTVEESHPNLYARLTKEQYSRVTDEIRRQVAHPMSLSEFYVYVSMALSSIKDDHTRVERPVGFTMPPVNESMRALSDRLRQLLKNDAEPENDDRYVPAPRKREHTAPFCYQLIPERDTCLMIVNSFGQPNEVQQYASQFREAFESLDRKKITHLVVDLRENRGGCGLTADELLKYLAKQPFRQFESVQQRIVPQFFALCEQWGLNVDSAMAEEYGIHLADMKSKGTYQPGILASGEVPFKQPHEPSKRFKGRIYFLIARPTFSTAANFAAAVKEFRIGTLLGQETSGQRDHFGQILPVHLPHSKLQCQVSTAHFVAVGGMQDRGGVKPDHEVRQTPEDNSRGIDTVLEYALALTREPIVVPGAGAGPVIGKAIQSAREGDTVRIKKGIYRETLVLTKRLELVGEAGAVVDPSEPFQAGWQPASEIGPGVYRTSSPRKPASLFFAGRVLAELDFRRADKEGPWHWKQLLASGPPRGGFRFIRALWMYHPSEKALYLHLPDNSTPAGADLSVIWTRDAVITLRNVAGASIRGLTLAHGAHGIALQEGTRACTVAQCVIGPWDKNGIFLGSGASGCLIQSNQVFRGAFEDWNPGDNSRERYEVWEIHKLVGYYDRVGIELLRPGTHNRIHGNHVYETFDGIDLGEESAVESLSKPLPHPEAGEGTEIAFNLIERTRDSGIELGGGCVDVQVHHNTLRQTHGGLRFKLPRLGPVFIYRNLLLEGAPFNIWYSMDDSPAEGYVYHNTIRGGRAGVIFSSFSPGEHTIGAPRWHHYNNLVVAKDGFFRNFEVIAPVNFAADYNLVVGGGKPWAKEPSKDSHSSYVERLLLAEDGRPVGASPAVDAGLDLSTAWPEKTLPGCEPGYFQGRGPDIGAFEIR